MNHIWPGGWSRWTIKLEYRSTARKRFAYYRYQPVREAPGVDYF